MQGPTSATRASGSSSRPRAASSTVPTRRPSRGPSRCATATTSPCSTRAASPTSAASCAPPSARCPRSRSCSRRSRPAPACPTPATARTCARASPRPTSRCTPICCPSGSAPSRTSTSGSCSPTPTSPTSPAAPATRAARSPRAYPLAHVDGFDDDPSSIARARAYRADRVRFFVQDAADPALDGSYDLVTIFQAVHDMSHPVQALRTARGLLAPGGTVIVADERVPEAFSAPSEDPHERLAYGFSMLHCLPVGRVGARRRRDRHGHAPAHARGLRAGGRLRGRRDPPDLQRPLALLPAQPTVVSSG